MVYSDSHAHLIDYSPDQLKKIIELMRKEQVELALAVGVNLDSSEGNFELAEAHSEIKAAIGIHPWFASRLDGYMRERFEKLASSKLTTAIGEVGLDYEPPVMGVPAGNPPGGPPPDIKFPDKMPPLPKTPASPEIQKGMFTFEVTIALKYGLPLNIHCLHGANQDMMEILRANPGLTGIAHGFEGDSKTLRDWLELGFYIAFGTKNVITEPMPDLENIVRATPLDRMVVETDANPMHSPDGPLGVIPICRKIAEIKGMTTEEIGQATTDNLKRVLKL